MTRTKHRTQGNVERAAPSGKQRIVCMDVLNFGTYFFGLMEENTMWENEIIRGRQKAKAFVQAANNGNIEIMGFVDQPVVYTAEAIKKWKTKRKKELKAGKMPGIPHMSSLIGSLFEEQGITIHYSTIDCDDTIAAFAYRLGADVLSQNNDFLRYSPPWYSSPSSVMLPPYKVFSQFHVEQGVLKLIPHPNNCKKSLSKRETLSTLPPTISSCYFLVKPNQHLVGVLKCPSAWDKVPPLYIRGCGTNLPKKFENPHLTLRPLRQALYWHFGVERVMEVLAVWNHNTKEPQFQETVVLADSMMADLLYKPAEAVKVLFKDQKKPKDCSEEAWSNQLFAQIVFTADICSWLSCKTALTIIDELLAENSLQAGKENQVSVIGSWYLKKVPIKDEEYTSQRRKKKAKQENLARSSPSYSDAASQLQMKIYHKLEIPSMENLSLSGGEREQAEDWKLVGTSRRGKKTTSETGKGNRTSIVGNQAPTKDGEYKQPSQTGKKSLYKVERKFKHFQWVYSPQQ